MLFKVPLVYVLPLVSVRVFTPLNHTAKSFSLYFIAILLNVFMSIVCVADACAIPPTLTLYVTLLAVLKYNQIEFDEVESFIESNLFVLSSASAAISAYKTPSLSLNVDALPAPLQVSATRVAVEPLVGIYEVA